jgi:hypothetical protein
MGSIPRPSAEPTVHLGDSEMAAGAFCDFALCVAVATGSDESRSVILNHDGAIRPRRRAESASQSVEQGEFPKGCRHKRPYTVHRTALLWSNRNEVWGRTSSI